MEATDARRMNRAAVLGALLDAGSTTRTAVARRTGLSTSTLSRTVDDLVAEHMVREIGRTARSGRGRRAVEIEVAPEAGCVVGVDLGGSSCRVAVSDLAGRGREVRRRATPTSRSGTALASWLVAFVERVHTELAADRPVRAVAVGVPGVVSPADGSVRGAVNLPQIDGDRFVGRLRAAFGHQVVFDNDANLAVLGETTTGAVKGRGDVVMFTVGTGLGCGVVVGGRLLRGRTGLAGEFGFFPVTAGRSVERFTSGGGLLGEARERGLPAADATELFADGTSRAVRGLRDRFLSGLALVTTAATLAYDPEAVVFGGGMTPAVAPLLDRLRERVARSVPSVPELCLSALGDDAGLLGALRCATDHARDELGAAARHGDDVAGGRA